MSVPRFFDRISDALSPLLRDTTHLREFLASKTVCLEAPNDLKDEPVHTAGFLLAVNLCARLYPRLRILAPDEVARECTELALQINPSCEIDTSAGASQGALAWALPSTDACSVTVAPCDWSVLLDPEEPAALRSSNILTSLAAATLGVSELFRIVFADFLPTRTRRRPTPAKFNILTLGETQEELPSLPSDIDIGRVHLVGAGAIGQAMLYTLARSSARGTLAVVDPERVALSNLQRYILTVDTDVDASKCSLAERAMRGTNVQVKRYECAWGDDSVNRDGDAEVVCAAVDTESARLGIQAGLPRRVYNAWTQPSDLGWSRHEDFGSTPCLACLYWPEATRPSQHQLIAWAIRQPELRVLAYLVRKIPVDRPLQAEEIPRVANLPIPADSHVWVSESLLAAIEASLGVPASELERWKGRQLSDVYREGVCGGALIRSQASPSSPELAVPLAHQSVLAGVMLAAELLIASSAELRRFRPASTEARLDLLTGFPQIAPRPRQRTAACICGDADFVERYRAKWPPKCTDPTTAR